MFDNNQTCKKREDNFSSCEIERETVINYKIHCSFEIQKEEEI